MRVIRLADLYGAAGESPLGSFREGNDWNNVGIDDELFDSGGGVCLDEGVEEERRSVALEYAPVVPKPKRFTAGTRV